MVPGERSACFQAALQSAQLRVFVLQAARMLSARYSDGKKKFSSSGMSGKLRALTSGERLLLLQEKKGSKMNEEMGPGSEAALGSDFRHLQNP